MGGFGASMLRGHTDVVICCDVSVDGRWIATGGKDQSIRVWNASDCRCVCKLAGHAGPVSALSFPKKKPKSRKTVAAEDNQPLMLVSGGQDKIMKVWELPSPAKMEETAQELSVAKSAQ